MYKSAGRPPADISGQRFGRLLVVERLPVIPGMRAKWHCLCDCGKDTTTTITHLRRGRTQSCGCLMRERLSEAKKTHGHSWPVYTAEYAAWSHMKQRCTNPNTKSYWAYGGRGITVCERWLKFENFLTDMGLKPHPNLTLERVNNDDGYSPENCRWATYADQLNNRRPSQPRKKIVPPEIIY